MYTIGCHCFLTKLTTMFWVIILMLIHLTIIFLTPHLSHKKKNEPSVYVFLKVFETNMDSVLYKQIIERVIFPFTVDKYNGQMNLQVTKQSQKQKIQKKNFKKKKCHLKSFLFTKNVTFFAYSDIT